MSKRLNLCGGFRRLLFSATGLAQAVLADVPTNRQRSTCHHKEPRPLADKCIQTEFLNTHQMTAGTSLNIFNSYNQNEVLLELQSSYISYATMMLNISRAVLLSKTSLLTDQNILMVKQAQLRCRVKVEIATTPLMEQTA